MRFLLTLFLLLPLTISATTYTEFYVQTTGSNLNSGHTTDDAATYTGTGGNWTNNTSATTGTWFKTGESLTAVTNGAWASLYTDGTTTNAQFVGLITAVDDAADTITLSLQNYCGANPSTVVAGMSVKVGGAWKGFTTNTMANGGGFPFNFLASTATNIQNSLPCCNIKSGTTYSVASPITHANAGPCRFEGYTTSPHDGGKATIDGGATGTSYVPLSVTGANTDLINLILQNNGNSGSAGQWLSVNVASCYLRGVVVHDTHRNGITFGGSAAGTVMTECEAYNCNKSGNAGSSGFAFGLATMRVENCISHDNTGANSDGFNSSTAGNFLRCIAYGNSRHGFYFTGQPIQMFNCDSYNNTGSGLHVNLATIAFLYIKNSNFLKNGSHGITNTASIRTGEIINCGFGSGTMANTGVNIANAGAINEFGSLTYTADTSPWTDPTTGNFAVATGSQARAAGRGTFPTNTISYPDIGAAQSASTNAAAASGGAYTWSQ